MGSHPTSLIKVTDVLLNMVAKASRQDEGFLLDLAAIQEKHIETAKLLLVEGPALNSFVSKLLDDIADLKAMLRAISIGGSTARSRPVLTVCISFSTLPVQFAVCSLNLFVSCSAFVASISCAPETALFAHTFSAFTCLVHAACSLQQNLHSMLHACTSLGALLV